MAKSFDQSSVSFNRLMYLSDYGLKNHVCKCKHIVIAVGFYVAQNIMISTYICVTFIIFAEILILRGNILVSLYHSVGSFGLKCARTKCVFNIKVDLSRLTDKRFNCIRFSCRRVLCKLRYTKFNQCLREQIK